MRVRVTSTVLVALALTACSDSPVAPGATSRSTSSAVSPYKAPVTGGASTAASGLYTTISGPTSIQMYSSYKYTAAVSGGTPPYTYQWRSRQYSRGAWGAYQNYFSTGSTNYTYASLTACGETEGELDVLVTDAGGLTASNAIYFYVSNPC